MKNNVEYSAQLVCVTEELYVSIFFFFLHSFMVYKHGSDYRYTESGNFTAYKYKFKRQAEMMRRKE